MKQSIGVLLASVTLVLTAQPNGKHSLLMYSPAKGWLSDPNGLVRVEETYHLFHQNSPDSDGGPTDMSWGHATSSDLVNWQEKGVAIPYNSTTFENRFSGSAVYDCDNTSGLGTTSSPPIVAIYTSHYGRDSSFPDGSPVAAGTQSQSLAFSLDKGKTWRTYHANPVIKHPPSQYADQYRDFRDPKVFWYEPHSKWVMVVAVPGPRIVLFYSSTNLIDWKYMSEFTSKYARDSFWECPDLYEMRVKNGYEKKWVFSPTVAFRDSIYLLGHFDGEKFVEDTNEISAIKRLDYGSDFYTGATFNNVGSRRLLLGWVNSPHYANRIASKYRGGISLVRELSLVKKGDDYKLIQKPVESIYNYVKFREDYSKVEVEDGIKIDQTDSSSFIFTICFTGVQEASFSLVLEDELHMDEAEIRYDHKDKIVYIKKLNVDSKREEPRVEHSAKLDAGIALKLKLFIDRRSLTLFCDDGEIVFTELLFSNSKIRTLRLQKGSTAGVREAFLQLLEEKIQ